jgi:biopolymer transport protein TolQ
VGVDVIGLMLQASWVVKLVLLLLAGFSVFSWAIILFKWRELRRAEQDSDAFLEVYHEGSLDAAYEAARELDQSPLAAVFLAGYAEINRMARYTGKVVGEALDGSQRHALSRHIQWTASSESLRLEKRLSFLATAGSATPFIGLFGTVIGIVNAFEGIGRSGSASLAVVAPGIAEALIATAVGLFAAIPATIAYNYFVGELRALQAAIDLFSREFEGDLERVGAAGTASARAARG